jgi:hypothetical protein
MEEIVSELKQRGVVNIGITLNPENLPTHKQAVHAMKHLLRHYLDGDYTVIDKIENEMGDDNAIGRTEQESSNRVEES